MPFLLQVYDTMIGLGSATCASQIGVVIGGLLGPLLGDSIQMGDYVMQLALFMVI